MSAKLGALVARQWGPDVGGARTPSTFTAADAVVAGMAQPPRGWLLPDGSPERILGPALAWARSVGVEELHVITDLAPGSSEAEALARRASFFSPVPQVWRVSGRSLEKVGPSPTPPEPGPPSSALAWITTIERAGAEAVVEEGSVRAEVLGLEVARVVSDAQGDRLEVGVGRFDRELRRMVEGDSDPGEALRRAVDQVLKWRRPDVAAHPANQLATERWLRAVVVRKPELLGPDAPHSLACLPAPVRRVDLGVRAPAPALGWRGSGQALLAVFSVGIDLDLVPAAAEARVRAGLLVPGPIELVVAVPQGDDHRVIREMAARLAQPAQVQTLPLDWRSH